MEVLSATTKRKNQKNNHEDKAADFSKNVHKTDIT
jgi:hypothetical protein